MSLQVEKLEKNMAKLTIEASAEEFENAVQKAYLKNKSRINLPGFRKGKAPRAMIEKMYGKGVFYEDAANTLIPEAYSKALAECELDIVSQPEISVTQIEAGKPFIFTAEVALKPEVTLGEYKGVAVPKKEVTVTDEEVQAELDKVVQEGMFNISINPDIRMTSGRAEAELRVENIPANRHLMSVTLSRDDTGEVLYASGLIEPGYHIQAVPLETVLPGGSYTATALFTAYDLETEQPAGQAAARVRITVAK